MPKLPPIVAALGNFDGLHVGHQRIIARVVETAKVCNGIPSVVTFYPLPSILLRPQQPFFQLMSFAEKRSQLLMLGIERVIKLRFNAIFMKMMPEVFVQQVLHQQLNIQHLVVGEDFRFGFQQQGDVHQLKQLAAALGLSCDTVSVEGPHKISSTTIRQALRAGDLATATELLGRPYAITGRVIHGRKQGRLLGVPTANIAMNRHRQGMKGTYIVNAIWQGKPYPAVANIGTRPTMGGKGILLEVHIMDFAGDLYGQRLTVEFVEKIRDEKRFESIEQLRDQIQEDIAQGRAHFRTALTEGDTR